MRATTPFNQVGPDAKTDQVPKGPLFGSQISNESGASLEHAKQD